MHLYRVLLPLVGTLLALSAGQAVAQAPIRFSNSAEAERLFEQRTLESLREKCARARSATLWERPEVAKLKRGFASVATDVPAGHYAVRSYDAGTRTFAHVEGQRLKPDTRLTLALALPRDYSYCRIVRDPAGMEWLEVTRSVSTAMTDGQAFDRLLQEAEELAAEPTVCTTGAKSALPPYRLVLSGTAAHFPDCTDARASLLARMSRLLRKVQER